MRKIKNVINMPYFILGKEKYDDRRLSEMSEADLKFLSNRIEEYISRTLEDINRFKEKGVDCAKDFENSGVDWLNKKKSFLERLKKLKPFINDLILQKENGGGREEQIRNIERTGDKRTLNDYFVDEARNFLDEKTFNAIMKNAEREMRILVGIKKV